MPKTSNQVLRDGAPPSASFSPVRSFIWGLSAVFATSASAGASVVPNAPSHIDTTSCALDRVSLESYPCLEEARAPVISPDGRTVAYRRHYIDASSRYDKRTELRLARVDGSVILSLGSGKDPKWSPDGRWLAYLEGADTATAVVLIAADGLGRRTIALLDGDISSPSWSSDGKQLALVRTSHAQPDPLYTLPSKIAATTGSKQPFDTTALHHQQDGVGHFGVATHEFLTLTLGGSVKRVTSVRGRLGSSDSALPLNKAKLSWSHDGKFILFDGNIEQGFDESANESYIYKLSISGGGVSRFVGRVDGHTKGYFSEPVVSPDGRYVAFKGIAWTRPFVVLPSEVWVADIDGGNIRRLTGIDADSPDNLLWSADSQRIAFTMFNRGNGMLYSVDRNGELAILKKENDGVMLVAHAIAADQQIAVTRTGFGLPSDIGLLATATRSYRPITTVGHSSVAGVRFGEHRRLEFKSRDGATITGWLLLPAPGASSKKYPLILRPDTGVGFSPEIETYRAEGYAVLLVHPRSAQNGSGFGQVFMNHMNGQFLSQELVDDHLAGLDAAIATGSVDPDRLFVAGSSMGGSITAWLLAHSARFKAGAVYRPTFINAISDVFTSDEVVFKYRYVGRSLWSDPSHWLKHSILMKADQITAPTLVVVGDEDIRTPPDQAIQLYKALKLLGKAPARLITMPGIHHGWGSDAATFMRLTGYTLGWFARFGGIRSPGGEIFRTTSPVTADNMIGAGDRTKVVCNGVVNCEAN